MLLVQVSVVALLLPAGAFSEKPGPATQADGAARPAQRSGQAPGNASGDALEAWLGSARSQPASRPAGGLDEGRNPFVGRSHRPADALPGQVELSDGRRINGWITTTPGKPWLLWIEEAKRYRRIPPAAVLSIAAVVTEEKQLPRWRWKAMGEPEKVYTGKLYPFRRLLWRFRLADGRTVTGSVKGQPLWIEAGGETHGPMLLHERQSGSDGQSLAELVYLRRVVITRRAVQARQ